MLYSQGHHGYNECVCCRQGQDLSGNDCMCFSHHGNVTEAMKTDTLRRHFQLRVITHLFSELFVTFLAQSAPTCLCGMGVWYGTLVFQTSGHMLSVIHTC